MANKVTIEVEARFVDEVTGKTKDAVEGLNDLGDAAGNAQKDLDKVGKKKVKPKLDVDDDQFTRKLNRSESKVKKLAGKTWSTTLKVLDKGTSIVNKLESGLKGIVKKTWTTVVKVKDLATAPLRGLKNMLFSIKSLVLAITAGLAAKQFIASPIALADAYSSAKIGFSTLLGESQGQQMMNDLDAFAKATPFKSSEVISQTQRMLAMGWDAENIIKDMGTIGDAAAATGKGEMGLQQIVTALAQIKTKGKLSTEELNQLAEAGISAKRYIAEGLGYGSGDEGIAKMTKDLENGAISSGKALEALLGGMKEYQGMMEQTANETVTGLWSQIQDTFEINIFRRWGQGLQDGAKKSFGSLVTLIDEADAALSEFGDTLYDIGKNISNWVAEKLENAVKRITEITGSFEFKNASLGEKISMLWNGVIVDPLKEWWEGGGQQKTAETAGKIGKWMGEMLTKGLLAILGVTDVFEDSNFGESGGMSVAQSFVKGFKENFDSSAITDAFVDAIGDIWGALPWWAKILIGGYAGGKTISGIGSFFGGITSAIGSRGTIAAGGAVTGASGLLGTIGRTGVAGVGASGILGGLANTGYTLLGGTSALSVGGGMAALAGGAGIAGGAAGAVSVGKGLYDLYGADKARREGDEVEAKAKTASGGTTLGGVAAGAALGATIGSVVPVIGTALGGLLGAGIGGVAGWIGGNKWAKNIRETKYETEGLAEELENAASEEEKAAAMSKARWEIMRDRMGDIKLTAAEIERLTDQIVWGDDLGNFDKYTAAVKNAESNLQSLKAAAENTERWMWKASLGVKFNEDEIESIKASFDEYIMSAGSFLENKHYEFTAAVSLLVDTESEEGKSIIESGNSFYAGMEKKLENLGRALSKTVDIALEDGVITLQEEKEIINIQKQMQEITNKIANAEQQAELELIKVKFGKGNLDPESFDNFMAQMQTSLDERMTASDEAFKASVSTLKLELAEGAITQDEYDKQIEALISGYTAKAEEIKAEIKDVELEIIGDAFGKDLGGNAKEKLQNALENSLADGIDPIEWTPEQARKYLGVSDLEDDVAGAIGEMLSGVASQLELVEVDGKILAKWTAESDGDPMSEIEELFPGIGPINETVDVHITGEKYVEAIEILNSDFGIPETEAETILFELSGQKTIKDQISYIALEFGIPESDAAEVLWNLTGKKGTITKFNLMASDFGVAGPYSFSPTVNITAQKGTVTPIRVSAHGLATIDEYRGGIVGGASAMGSFARGGIAGFSDGGMVRGGSQLIEVAEEGSPEMIIPLSSQRRGRALKLWAQAGNIMGVPGFARGGLTSGRPDEGIRFHTFGGGTAPSGQTVEVDIGGITFEITVDATDGQTVAEAIREQSDEIAETVAGILADAFGGQFENTPARGGIA